MKKLQIELVKLQNWLKNTICKTTIDYIPFSNTPHIFSTISSSKCKVC